MGHVNTTTKKKVKPVRRTKHDGQSKQTMHTNDVRQKRVRKIELQIITRPLLEM